MFVSTRSCPIKPLNVTKDGWVKKVKFKAQTNLEHWQLPFDTYLSYGWKDSNGNTYTIVTEPDRESYLAPSSIMFLK